MTNLDAVLVELKKERERLNQAIAALESVSSNGSATSRLSGERTISAAGRRRIVLAQKARWRAWKAKLKKR